MTTATPDILVRYTRNSDSTLATESLRFNDDDRSDLLIGELGYVTELEIHQAASHGIVLEPTDAAEAEDLGLDVPPSPNAEGEAGDDLDGLSNAELRAKAKDEGIDLAGARSNEDITVAIREARAPEVPEGRDSLPATAAGSTGPSLGTGSDASSTLSTGGLVS